MKIRTRLTLWYAAVLSVSLVLFSAGLFRELYEQVKHSPRAASEAHALHETQELVFEIGLPALILGLAGGWWLTRRALSPMRELIRAVRRMDERSLKEPLPRSGNGDEIDQLTEVLNGANARLNESFSRIREFTLHASHELKTPLTVLQNEWETQLREENLSALQREHLASQLDEVQRLTRIVSGLTLLAKADAGQIPLKREAVRLDDLVRNAYEDAVNLGAGRQLKVQLEVCETATVSGDADRLRQLLLNLVDNAVKYAESGGSLCMTLRCASGQACFVMSNSGPGIPPEKLPRVFDRFYRCDLAHGNEVEGCGLGLSIAKWIVTAHEGAVQIDSIPGKLTTVTVRLPLSAQ